MLSQPNSMPAGDAIRVCSKKGKERHINKSFICTHYSLGERHLQLSADAAKQLNPTTASTLWKPKLRGAQAGARHNTTRRAGKKKDRSRRHRRESREDVESV